MRQLAKFPDKSIDTIEKISKNSFKEQRYNEPPQSKLCDILSVTLFQNEGSFEWKFIVPSGLIPGPLKDLIHYSRSRVPGY